MRPQIATSDHLLSMGLKRAEIALVVTRADGSVENLGIVAATDFRPSPLTRILNWLGVK